MSDEKFGSFYFDPETSYGHLDSILTSSFNYKIAIFSKQFSKLFFNENYYFRVRYLAVQPNYKVSGGPKHGSTLVCYLLRSGRTRVQILAREIIINSE